MATALKKFYIGGAYVVDLTKYLMTSDLNTQVNSLGYAKTADITDTYGYLVTLLTESAGTATVNATTLKVGSKTVATTDQLVTVDQTYSSTSTNAQSGKAVAQALATVTTITYQVVDALPSTGTVNVIYLVPSSNSTTQNTKDEYMWINNAWEQIGSTAVDLSGYVTTSALNTTLQNYVTTSTLTSTLSPYAKTADVTTAINTAVATKLQRSDLTQSAWSALSSYDENTIYVITDVLA